jgi:alanine dehydrogenase
VFSALHLPTISEPFLKELKKRNVTAIAYEYLRDSEDNLPIVRSMGEIAGISAVLIAAEYLSKQFHGNGKLLGGITGVPPSKIIILGAGTVAEYAVKAALGLGAEVRVFDNSLSKLRRLQNNVGQRFYTSVIQPIVLENELKTADVAIGAIHSTSGRTPMVVPEYMVQGMKNGAVIIDVSIDQGGCFETSQITSHTKPTIVKHGVVHYGVPNIPSQVSKTASIALSNILANFMLNILQHGGLQNAIWIEKGLRSGVYCFNGSLTNKYLCHRFGFDFTNLELLSAARF